MPVTHLTRTGRVAIPRDVRERRRWKPGQALDVVETADGVLLRPRPEHAEPEEVGRALDDLARTFGYRSPTVLVEKLGVEAINYRDLYPDGP